jgi:DNA modification methylase
MSKQDKIICLGKEFNSEEERREYFRNELRAKLPDLKKIEGFPIGEDDDIINLSDPPYYTACPNPWLNTFIKEWEAKKANQLGRDKDFIVDGPYASDISEGKGHPIYNAHSYHTKVPHLAIVKYLLHYTQPGDIVLDYFGGTGMTGVAAQYCQDIDEVTKYKIEQEFVKDFGVKPKWGCRNSIIGDLSPIATFISSNYTLPVDHEEFRHCIDYLLNTIEKELGWMYETRHSSNQMGKINCVVWSDIFNCNVCNAEINLWNSAVDQEKGEIKDEFNCPNCKSIVSKKVINRSFETYYDDGLNTTIQKCKSVPVLITYIFNGKRYEKKPDVFDLDVIDRINNTKIDFWYPTSRMIEGRESRRNDLAGITHVHHFYTRRNLIELSYINQKLPTKYKFIFTSLLTRSSKQARFLAKNYFHGGGGWVGTNLSGTLFIPSFSIEVRPSFTLRNRTDIFDCIKGSYKTLISTSSASSTGLSDDSIDYIFTDPPFGSNLMYSELNNINEAWLNVLTNVNHEAIENKPLNKTLLDYQEIMTKCFDEYYRILKPNKWMTVEFSNTSAAVWNGIQTALQRAGFIISNISALDKQQGSFKAVTTATAVKQDLVISCYKPSNDFEICFLSSSMEIVIWDFISQHLQHLPIHIRKDNSTTAIVERSSKILYDRLITFYLMRGLPVPIDAKDFQEELKQRFIERDGMYFTAEQAAAYEEKKSMAPQFVQLSLIVTNESDAIEWLKDRLRKQAQKYQDIMPDFRIATQSLRKGDTLPELQDILNENFIQEPDGRWRSPDPNEAKDREALRTKVLLREFNGYVTAISQPRAKKLKVVRVEALRAGFKNCWEQKDFKTIVTLGDMIPQNILLEDEQLLMYYDIAKDRV